MDLETLRSMRKKSFSKISEEMDNIANNNKSYEDDRVWQVQPDKAGNGSAIIRFLPGLDPNALPWVKMYTYGFQGPTGKWYIENSLTTLGEDDPATDYNTKLWTSGIEANKEIARKQARQLKYISNILVISDPKNPENEGQVRLFKYGSKIFDKLKDVAKPVFEDDIPVDVFDPDKGANFKFRMRREKGYANFDQSVFLEPSPIADTDEEILEILNRQYDLSELVSRKHFKSYEELSKKLNAVLSPAGGPSKTAESDDSQDGDNDAPARKIVPQITITYDDDEDEDAMEFFKKIALEE